MTTKTRTRPKPAQVLNRIRQCMTRIAHAVKDHREQMHELSKDTYIYIELLMTDGYSKADAFIELAEKLDATYNRVTHWYKRGFFMRTQSINTKKARASSLAQVACRTITNRTHLKKLVSMLNDGVGPSDINRQMAKYGYKSDPATPPWARKLAKKKEMIKDWEGELVEMRKALETCAPGDTVRIVVSIDGRRVIAV